MWHTVCLFSYFIDGQLLVNKIKREILKENWTQQQQQQHHSQSIETRLSRFFFTSLFSSYKYFFSQSTVSWSIRCELKRWECVRAVSGECCWAQSAFSDSVHICTSLFWRFKYILRKKKYIYCTKWLTLDWQMNWCGPE